MSSASRAAADDPERKVNMKNVHTILSKIKLHHILIVLILSVAIFVRVWRFGTLPNGLMPDEASTGVDAYDLLHYGMDRNGTSWPVIFISWGGGQNALYAYAIMPFIAAGGLQSHHSSIADAVIRPVVVAPDVFRRQKDMGNQRGTHRDVPARYQPLAHHPFPLGARIQFTSLCVLMRLLLFTVIGRKQPLDFTRCNILRIVILRIRHRVCRNPYLPSFRRPNLVKRQNELAPKTWQSALRCFSSSVCPLASILQSTA